MSNHPIKILVVDDEPDILEIIEYNLKKEGYDVYLASNGEECLKIAKDLKPHLIILDIMMPRLDGIETCKRLRSFPEFQKTFIMFLTARNEEMTEISSFHVGADDYVTKPIKPIALISRIKAILRRLTENADNPTSIQIKNVIIDKNSYKVFLNKTELVFTRKEFELLYMLASNPGKVLRRSEILDSVWGNETIVTDRTIDVHIRKIREKIGNEIIHTIKGVGYRVDH